MPIGYSELDDGLDNEETLREESPDDDDDDGIVNPVLDDMYDSDIVD